MKHAMQTQPLFVNSILDYAERYYGQQMIVSKMLDGSIQRQSYKQTHQRTKKLSKALQKIGAKKSDVIATLAWNDYRHIESWYAITGIGAVYHSLNPRLFPQQIAYIINHAEDKFIFCDISFLPILEAIQSELKTVKAYIIMCDEQTMPETKLKNTYCYETLIQQQEDGFDWVIVDENDPCGICYTSGTTGNPKGVVYTHRSNVLHALTIVMPNIMKLSQYDNILMIVPMFHANAWGMVFAAPLVGAQITNPGAHLDGESIYNLLNDEKPNIAAAVPVIWQWLQQYLSENKKQLLYLNDAVIGGAAVSRNMIEVFEKKYDVRVYQGWGMTEMSPVGAFSRLTPELETCSEEIKFSTQEKAGRPPYLVDIKITDEAGESLPWDGKTYGYLKAKGPYIAASYLKNEDNILDDQGYFDTGDIATIDHNGYIKITDRAKDIIKSGGEWISSVDIENIILGKESVAEAAVIGLPHPEWDERPLLIIVQEQGKQIDKEEVFTYLEGKIAKFWMPNDVIFVKEIPYTGTGKINKMQLREEFKEYQWINKI